MPMETFTKEFGKRIWPMGKEYSWILLELNILGNGLMTFSMVLEKKAGIMGKLNMLAHSIRERRMEKVDLNGKMEASMKVTLLMDISRDMVSLIYTNFIF